MKNARPGPAASSKRRARRRRHAALLSGCGSCIGLTLPRGAYIPRARTVTKPLPACACSTMACSRRPMASSRLESAQLFVEGERADNIAASASSMACWSLRYMLSYRRMPAAASALRRLMACRLRATSVLALRVAITAHHLRPYLPDCHGPEPILPCRRRRQGGPGAHPVLKPIWICCKCVAELEASRRASVRRRQQRNLLGPLDGHGQLALAPGAVAGDSAASGPLVRSGKRPVSYNRCGRFVDAERKPSSAPPFPPHKHSSHLNRRPRTEVRAAFKREFRLQSLKGSAAGPVPSDGLSFG